MCVALLAACAPASTEGVRGRLLFWHSRAADAEAIATIVADFEEIYPGVEVVIEVIPEADLRRRYSGAATLGLGPDVFIASSRWIPDLADDGLIQDIGPDEPALGQYLTVALANVAYDVGDDGEGLYGLPFSLEPVALYYNVERISSPPQTLDDMLALGQGGTNIGILTRFDGGMWGVGALGGALLDDTGRVVLDQGAFASWLAWLQTAGQIDGLTLSRDGEVLRELFISGELDAYVGTPDDLPLVQAALGTTGYAVAPLPGSQGGAAGPLLGVDALLFNPATSDATREAALELARFVTNDEQSRALIRTRNIVPANRRIQPNAQLYPGIAGFVTQSRTAVAVPNTVTMDALLAQGDTLIQQVLTGVVSGPEAATILTAEVNTLAGFPVGVTVVQGCTLRGTLELWHSWEGVDLAALERVVMAYGSACPDVTIEAVALPNVADGFGSVVGTEIEPDAMLISSTVLFDMVDENLLQSLILDNTEQFTPAALETTRVRNIQYGIPVSMHKSVLYFNTTMIADPSVTLDDLVNAARAGTGVALPRTFEAAYWGAPAYGVTLFAEDGRLLLDAGGFAAWLGWMAQMNLFPSVTMGTDRQNREVFANGEVAYYVGPPEALLPLREALGEAAVGTVTLPSGPAAPAAPVLTTTAFVANANNDERTQEIAQDFGLFLANVESQTTFAQDAWRVPVNVNVLLDDQPTLQTFREQTPQVTVLPRIPQLAPLLVRGNTVYRAVLDNGTAPEDAVADLVASVNEANGFEPTPMPATTTPTDDVALTPDAAITPSATSEGE